MKFCKFGVLFYLPKYKVFRTKDVTSPTCKTFIMICFKLSKKLCQLNSLQQFREVCLLRRGTKSSQTLAEPSNRLGFQNESFARR